MLHLVAMPPDPSKQGTRAGQGRTYHLRQFLLSQSLQLFQADPVLVGHFGEKPCKCAAASGGKFGV